MNPSQLGEAGHHSGEDRPLHLIPILDSIDSTVSIRFNSFAYLLYSTIIIDVVEGH